MENKIDQEFEQKILDEINKIDTKFFEYTDKAKSTAQELKNQIDENKKSNKLILENILKNNNIQLSSLKNIEIKLESEIASLSNKLDLELATFQNELLLSIEKNKLEIDSLKVSTR
jgi:Fe-S-cluster formation regulator IscX/YfhJ